MYKILFQIKTKIYSNICFSKQPQLQALLSKPGSRRAEFGRDHSRNRYWFWCRIYSTKSCRQSFVDSKDLGGGVELEISRWNITKSNSTCTKTHDIMQDRFAHSKIEQCECAILFYPISMQMKAIQQNTILFHFALHYYVLWYCTMCLKFLCFSTLCYCTVYDPGFILLLWIVAGHKRGVFTSSCRAEALSYK